MESNYFTSLLNGNTYHEVDDIQSSQIPPLSQEPTQSKKGRATNFSVEEDMLLISAWQNVSMDQIQGSNQTHQTYWDRIASYYDENKSFSNERTPTSLCHRWSTINAAVAKFIGYYNQIQGRHQSGVGEQDKVRQAMEMYTSLQKKPFQLIHCWTELRNCIKFSANMAKKTKKGTNDSPPSSASAQSQFISNPAVETEDKMARPMGRKAAKKLKRTEYEASGGELSAAINQVKATLTGISESRSEAIQQLIELEKERLMAADERERAREERECRMYEISILGTDTSTMEAPLAEYYNSLKTDILKKRRI